MISSAWYSFEDSYHLGINLGHDRAAAITSRACLLVAIEEERLDRQKHSPGIQRGNGKVQLDLPWNAIRYCLDAVGTDLHELASVTANSRERDCGPQLAARGYQSSSCRGPSPAFCLRFVMTQGQTCPRHPNRKSEGKKL